MSTEFTTVSNGQTIEADHVNQFAQPIQDLESGAALYRVATGTGAPYIVDFTKAVNPNHHLDSLVAGQIIVFKASADSPASATLQVNFEGGTNSGSIPLNAGDIQVGADQIKANQIVVAIYNNTSTPRFDIASAGGGGSAIALDDLSDVTITGTPASGEVLQHDGAGNFVNRTLASAGIAADSHTHPIGDITSLQTSLDAKQATSEKGAANGYAALDGTGKVPSSQLPSGGGSTIGAGEIGYGAAGTGNLTSDSSLTYDGSSLTYSGTNAAELEGSGSNSVALGANAASSGVSSTSVGHDASATGDRTVSVGYATVNPSLGGIAIGDAATTGVNPKATAIGDGASATGHYDLALGSSATATPNFSIAIGHTANASGSGEVKTAIGYQANSTGGSSMAVGPSTDATGTGSVALGNGAQSTTSNSIALGTTASAGTAGEGMAFGTNSSCTGGFSQALGAQSTATTEVSIAVGFQANANSAQTLAVGRQANADASQATALGYLADAGGISSVALGHSADAPGNYDLSAGYNATAGLGYSVALGCNSVAYSNGGVAIGNSSSASGGSGYSNNVAIGPSASAGSGGTNAVAIGKSASASGPSTVAIGSSASGGVNAVAVGVGAVANATSSFAGGSSASSLGASSVALGVSAKADFNYGMALGAKAETKATYQIVIGGPGFGGDPNECYIGRGVYNTQATQQTMLWSTAGGEGTDNPGNNLRIAAGRPTGSATGGDLRFATAPPGSTGASLQALVDRLVLTDTGEIGMFGATPVAQSTGWSITNGNTRKSIDTTTVTLSELAEAFGTLVDYLKSLGPLGA